MHAHVDPAVPNPADVNLVCSPTAARCPRFGFSTDKAALLEAPFPREAFMAMELVNGALFGVQGQVIYPPPFGI
jgi:predicted N-acetyltransferase YhbS